jgi:hypothetical protein
MGLAIGLFALFFLVLTALSFAVVRLFAGRDGQGRRDPASCLVGCAVGAGLLAIGLMGLIALIGSLVIVTGSRAVQSIPVRSIYFGTEPGAIEGQSEPGAPGSEGREAPSAPPRFVSDPARPLHVVFEIDGELRVPERMEEWIREWSDGEARVRIEERTEPDGRRVTWVDVALPAEWRDLRRIEEEVRDFFPKASWAGGLRIDFKSVGRDW